MNKNVEFFQCEHCGNIIVKLVDAGVPVSCCGENMVLMKANTKDAALEKHVPAFIDDKVQIGSVSHPMTEEHFIQFIFATDGEVCMYKKLTPADEPVMKLDASRVDKAFEFCNLHGFWEGSK